MNRILVKDALTEIPPGTELTLCGWVRTVRTSKGGFSFLALNDGSCLSNIQIVADEKLPNYRDEILHLTSGASVVVQGRLVESPAKGQRVEVQASQVRLLGPADPRRYPIQPKRHSFEYLRTQAHLRPRTNTFGAVARVRSTVSAAIHEFFQSRGFLYIHTPIITASDCEGAGELFRVTTPRGASAAGRESPDEAEDFFGRATYLTVSGQLEAEAYACALGKVYTFGPTFRAENSNTPRHLAEFWMVEPEMAFCDLAGDADLAEEFVKFLSQTVMDRCAEDMAFFNQWIDKTALERLQHVAESDFERITYTEAVALLAQSPKTWDYPPDWGKNLQTEHERFLTEEVFGCPVIVTDLTTTARPSRRWISLSRGSERSSAAHSGKSVWRFWKRGWSSRTFARRLTGGTWTCAVTAPSRTPGSGWFGLGLERLIQFVTGMANIRDVIPFPRTPRSAEF